jgi:hypothetical protein
LQTFSEEFNNAAYGASAGSVTGINAGIAPNGTSTADEITSTGGGIFRPLTVATATVYTASVYAKYVSGSANFSFGCDSNPSSARSTFNLQTGAVTANGANVTSSSIIPIGNGWYRCIVTFTSTSTSIILAYYNATSGSKYFVWGAQPEAASTPSSYIPTTTAAVTRSADVASITGSAFSSWYRQDEGTMFANWENLAAAMPSGSAQWLAEFNDGTTSNRRSFFQIQAANSLVSQNSFASGSGAGRLDTGGPYAKIPAKASAAFASLDRSLVANGGPAAESSAGITPAGINQLNIGSVLGTAFLNGHIRRLCYWPQRLANSTLQNITQ